jgi:hypothetical protein
MHLVRDALVRVGKNTDSGQSLLMDLAGGIVAAVGKDNLGRSITAALDGGVELTIGPSLANPGKALRIEFNGDVDWTVKGAFHLNCTGDMVLEGTNIHHIAKCDMLASAQNIGQYATVQHTVESPNPVVTQGGVPPTAPGAVLA